MTVNSRQEIHQSFHAKNYNYFLAKQFQTLIHRNNLKTALGASGLKPGTRAGFLRPETQSRLQTAKGRTAKTARPITSLTGRQTRMKTAALLTDAGEFIDVMRINTNRYGSDLHYAPIIFDYLLHHQPDARFALRLAETAKENSPKHFQFWNLALAKCYIRLGMFRKAEQQLQLCRNYSITSVLLFSKIYLKLRQPKSALSCIEQAERVWPNNLSLFTQKARIYQSEFDDTAKSIEFYRKVLNTDRNDVEAISSLATENFYHEHPEISLKFYQQLLSQNRNDWMKENLVQIFNNIGLWAVFTTIFKYNA